MDKGDHMPAAAPRSARRARALLAGSGNAGAILDPDAAAMGFDDLLGDRTGRTGILPGPCMRPVV